MSCVQAEHLNGPLELVFEDSRLFLDQRPRDFNDLFRVILNFMPEVKVPQDVILEYSGPDGISIIVHDLSLQESYILSGKHKLIIGVRLSLSCPRKILSPRQSTIYF